MVRGFCRVVGLVKTGLFLACAAAATNITRLRSWAAQVGNTSIEPAQPDPPNYGFEEVGADGLILTKPNAPPGT